MSDKFLTIDDPRDVPAWLRKRAEGHAPEGDIAVFARPRTWLALADAIEACSRPSHPMSGIDKAMYEQNQKMGKTIMQYRELFMRLLDAKQKRYPMPKEQAPAPDRVEIMNIEKEEYERWKLVQQIIDAASYDASLPPSPPADSEGVKIRKEFHFWMDARRFSSDRERLTGGEIKAIANTQPAYPVRRDNGRYPSDDTSIGDGELVNIDGAHFYSLIPATYRR